jgi:TonB-dependent starch-binding outer membrane protein SusC
MNKLKSMKLKIMVVLSILFISSGVFAQIEIKGQVTDESNEPLVGVTVVEKGTTNGIATDINGKYTISVSGQNSLLVYSFIGFESYEVQVGNSKNIDVSLEASSYSLDEVVAVGYGSMKRSDITGSVASIKLADDDKMGQSSMEDLMRGRIAGVQIMGSDNTPGTSSSIRIRGGTSVNASNEPLYVVDGFPILNSTPSGDGSYEPNSLSVISDIDPNNIESIEVLKDASATAIYGSRGANGVILITTKKGQAGKMDLNVKVSGGIMSMVNNYNPMDAYTYANYTNQMRYPYPYTHDIELDPLEPGQVEGFIRQTRYPEDFKNAQSTNWIDEISRMGNYQEYYVGGSGGSEKSRYAGSIGYYNNEGIIKSTDFDRFTGSFSLDLLPNKVIEIGMSSNLSYADVQGVVTTNNPDVVNTLGVLVNALAFNPAYDPETMADEPIYSEDGMLSLTNPVYNVTDIDKNTQYFKGTLNAYLKVNFTENLFFKTMFGGRYNGVKYKSFEPSTTTYGLQFNGNAEVNNRFSINSLMENTLNYRLKVNKHSLNAVIGMTAQKDHYEYQGQRSNFFDTELLGYNSLGMATNHFPPVTSTNEWQLLSYLGRVNYNYKGRYVVTASMRADGSSRLSENNKWGYFPSFAAAWRVSEEGFMKDIGWLNNMKLRAGYGITGNQSIPLYSSQALMSSGNAYVFPNNVVNVGVKADRLANADLKWETTTQINAGLDVSFLDSRINASVDYYTKETTDLLLNQPVPSTSGFSSLMLNSGSVSNKGWEFEINAVVLDGKLEWTTGFNIARNVNEVTDLGEKGDIFLGKSSYEGIITVGEPLGSWYGYQSDGIWTQEDLDFHRTPDGTVVFSVIPGHEHATLPNEVLKYGARKYKDISGPDGEPDGIINSYDRSVIGRAQPKFFGGWTNSFSYKNFDLSLFFEYSYGREVYNLTKRNFVDNQTAHNHMDEDIYYPIQYALVENNEGNFVEDKNNVVNPGNPTGVFPMFSQGDLAGWTIDQFMEDASYFRLKDLTLGYTIPKIAVAKIGLSGCKVFIKGTNIFTLTNYTGNDPAVNTDGHTNAASGAGLLQGKDWNAYPLSRTFSIGINAKF